jgi:hypothetical protein
MDAHGLDEKGRHPRFPWWMPQSSAKVEFVSGTAMWIRTDGIVCAAECDPMGGLLYLSDAPFIEADRRWPRGDTSSAPEDPFAAFGKPVEINVDDWRPPKPTRWQRFTRGLQRVLQAFWGLFLFAALAYGTWRIWGDMALQATMPEDPHWRAVISPRADYECWRSRSNENAVCFPKVNP